MRWHRFTVIAGVTLSVPTLALAANYTQRRPNTGATVNLHQDSGISLRPTLAGQINQVTELRKQSNKIPDTVMRRTVFGNSIKMMISAMDTHWKQKRPLDSFESVTWNHYLGKVVGSLADYRSYQSDVAAGRRVEPPNSLAGLEQQDVEKYFRLIAMYLANSGVKFEIEKAAELGRFYPSAFVNTVHALHGLVRNETLVVPRGKPEIQLDEARRVPTREELAQREVVKKIRPIDPNKTFRVAGDVTKLWDQIVKNTQALTGEYFMDGVVVRNGLEIPVEYRHPLTRIIDRYHTLMDGRLGIFWGESFGSLLSDEGYHLGQEIEQLAGYFSRLDRALVNGSRPPFMPNHPKRSIVHNGSVRFAANSAEAANAIEVLQSVDTYWSPYSQSVVRRYWQGLYDELVNVEEGTLSMDDIYAFVEQMNERLPVVPATSNSYR